MRCFMATAEECRLALESLTGRIAEMDPADRQAHLVDRVISCKVSDLGVTFVTKLGPDGASPVREANGSEPPAQVRFTAKSDDLVAIARDPESIGRAWLTGRLKVEASIWDILRLRKIL
jgi:predicted lipid carrier protein YhbT